ncbi:MAG: AmmeMemoRadiSam system protein B [Thermoprotei archaeon]
MNRKPAVADGFYPSSPALLLKDIERSFSLGFGNPGKPEVGSGGAQSHRHVNRLAAIAPHAGYTYSGAVASYTYGYAVSKMVPETVIVVGPNHTGYGSDVSVWPDGEWETPIGSLRVDSEAASVILHDFEHFDPSSHELEHSIEVQLPFIRYVYGEEAAIVPVCVLDQSVETMMRLGETLARAAQVRERTLLVASSDFSHYVPERYAREVDLELLKQIEAMDELAVARKADELDSNACGLGPIIAVVSAAKRLGLTRARLLKYSTSAEATGDRESVVGYASMVFEANGQEV